MALKLKRPAPLSELETTYYIEYRTRRTARGERQEPEVVVYIVSGSRATDVVNLTFPDPVSVELNDAIAVSVGRFVDHAAGLEIEVVNTYPWAVDLHISFDPTSCVRAAPAIKAAPRETPYLLADSTIPFSLALTSRDSENCGPSRPNLHLQAPGGWNVQQDSETSMLQPGGTVHMEVSVTIPSSEAPGFRDLEWSVEGHALIEAHRATMLFVKPSTGDMPTTDPIPSPTRTVNVSNSSQLSSALSSAQPGDHIVLANGSYSGFTVSKSGQDGKPIVVRAATTGGARIGGHITIEGDHVWVVGTNMAANTIFVKGNFSRISKNSFDQHQKTGWAGISVDRAITNAEIDHNEHAGGATGHDAIDVRVACDKKHNHYIHHNYIHDSTGDGDGIGVGFGNSCDGNSRIEYNLITNWKGKYCMYEKGGANTWAFNTCIGPGLGAQSRGFSRETLTNSTIGSTRNEWIANWFEGASANLRIFGAHNRVIGNNMNSGKVQLGCGNFRLGEPSNNPSEHKGYVAATDNLVAGNKGNLTVGVIYSGVCEGTAFNGNSYPAKDNKVQAHQGNITYGKHQGTNVTANTSVTVPQAKKLTPSQVGPNAPTAPKL